MHESHGQIQAFNSWHLNDIQMLAKSKSYIYSIIHSPWEILNTHKHVFNHIHAHTFAAHGRSKIHKYMYSIIHMYTHTFPNKCIQSYNKHTHSQPKEDLKYTHTCIQPSHTQMYSIIHTYMYSIIHTHTCI